MFLCPLQEEGEEHLGQTEQGWWESFETFYVAVIEPSVESYHLIYIRIMSILLVDEYRGARMALK